MASPSGTRRFLYDGDRLISEYDAAGTIIGNYTHGPGPDEPLLSWEASNNYATRYFHADHQGSVVAAADDAGNLTAISAYDPWGVPNASNVGRFGYTGQTWVPELGMWYYKARIYSPMLGRFLQSDPVGYQGGMNLYAYVMDDPIDHNDSTGLAPAAEVDQAARSVDRLVAAMERDIKSTQAENGGHLISGNAQDRVNVLKNEIKRLRDLDPKQLADMRVSSSSSDRGLFNAMRRADAEQIYVAMISNGTVSYRPATMSSQTTDSGMTTLGRGIMISFGHMHEQAPGREHAGVGDPGNVLIQGKPMVYGEGRNANAIGWNGTHFTLTNVAGKAPSYSSAPGWIRDTFAPW